MNVAIIAAAGQGTRIGGKRAKQFLELAGTPIIFHTLKPFEQCDAIHEIILVLPAEEVAGFLELIPKFALRKLTRVVAGGATRTESVLRGLQAIPSAGVEVVAVHDGVRPFVTADEISKTVEKARSVGAAILVGGVVDTIKKVSQGCVTETPGRSDLRRALTPQCFRYSLLWRAYESVDIAETDITDDSLLVERIGVQVAIVEGSSRNIKITQPEDLLLAEELIKQS
jgi:2-C-methyl-D-erythritol 4-phosphate cytidylyltransferase